jgi:hypothetical protein
MNLKLFIDLRIQLLFQELADATVSGMKPGPFSVAL